MARFDPGRPAGDEHLPYWGQYIELVPDGDIADVLESQISTTVDSLRALTPVQAGRRPAPGEWNALEIVGHLADTERVLAYRVLRIARADPVLWESIEFEPYVEHGEFDGRELWTLIDEFVATRAATVAMLRGLGEAAWQRRMPEEWSCRSVRSLAYVIAGHELHHLADIRGKELAAQAGVRQI
ncbi:MAG TPA: DinB family protein [Thermomicrobiales bacterium]|nr:DinB family protein [Thermomicrobiales bacterium]